ncbi:MAG: hypothetical protein JRD84_07185 [Deltaproteobacteria bacterium]|nr:hypothetical protein [Deltaproteobacteria bacterium]
MKSKPGSPSGLQALRAGSCWARIFTQWEWFLDERMNFTSAVSLAEAYPAAVVAAILAGKTLRTGMFFEAPIRCLRNVHFTLQSGDCYKGHD